MVVATQAIPSNYSENTNQEFCPNEKDSLCRFQNNKVTGKSEHKPTMHPLPKAEVNVIRPLFNRLSKREFLAACVKCRTQNEPHHAVRSLAPKSTYTRPLEIKLAVELGALLLNIGFSKCFENVSKEMGVTVSKNMLEQWEVIQDERIRNNNRQEKTTFKERRKQLKQKKKN